jgi:dTDP-L-rhamnose 4-epimerase
MPHVGNGASGALVSRVLRVYLCDGWEQGLRVAHVVRLLRCILHMDRCSPARLQRHEEEKKALPTCRFNYLRRVEPCVGWFLAGAGATKERATCHGSEKALMADHILITGGAGFIGSHLADELLARGYRVRALDSLCEQVHGPSGRSPEYLHPDVELVVGDVRDPESVRRALDRVDAVFHFAARVGVGQSMYEIADYTSVNEQGTAQLLEALARHPVERLIVASSMSIYGEGLYQDLRGSLVAGSDRPLAQLRSHTWELHTAEGDRLTPVPTPETKPPALSSIYALSKFAQEQMCLLTGRAYGIPTVALRFFNVYGSRQALSNPYTGVLAIFASRLLNGRPPLVFEDGEQQRDFVSVQDVARACRLALETPGAAHQVFNVGSGSRYTIHEIAVRMAQAVGRDDIEPTITNKHRIGDIRHCFANINRACEVLGYKPQIALEDGLARLADWLQGQIPVDRLDEASYKLDSRRLTV